MNITYNEKQQIFHLKAKDTSYIIEIFKEGYLVHNYWGKRIEKYHGSNSIRTKDRAFSPNPNKEDRAFSLDTIPQEFPAYGTTDFRSPAIELVYPDGTSISDFRYVSHEIVQGKKSLEGLPSLYADDLEVETLVILMKDRLYDVFLELKYTVFHDYPVITRSVNVRNELQDLIKINKLASMNVDFQSSNYKLMHLAGAWGREREVVEQPLTQGVFQIESRRGASSHQHNPFYALATKNTTETCGEVYAMNFVYSGNFLAQVEVDSFRSTRLNMGINPFQFEWTLESNQSFQSPEVVMVYSDSGYGKMSRTLHKLYRNHLIRGKYKEQERPILLNNWEATYFDFDEQKLLDLADVAKETGIELFVLDDGWFKNRNSDTSSLGDWIVDQKKLPNGLDHLANTIKEKNLSFGLWVEPEMISADSDLYRIHPDWCLHVEGRRKSESRNQLILDYTRSEVRAKIVEMLRKVFSSAPVSYVKWDMNRNMTEAYSMALPIDRRLETMHRYMLGLYEILETLTSEFPDILFESCSGGGGRYDAGMLYYMPQTWTSDNTDAIERLKIQYGTSMVYPAITMGSHVADVPNHQVHRITPISTRGNVAMSGNLGYELDLMKLSTAEVSSIHSQIKTYKTIRHIVQLGDLYRLISPFESNLTAWMYVSETKDEAILFHFKKLAYAQEVFEQVKLLGLEESAIYEDQYENTYGGDELMHIGYQIPDLEGDFQSGMVYLKKKTK